jgi:hypothetical protein
MLRAEGGVWKVSTTRRLEDAHFENSKLLQQMQALAKGSNGCFNVHKQMLPISRKALAAWQDMVCACARARQPRRQTTHGISALVQRCGSKKKHVGLSATAVHKYLDILEVRLRMRGSGCGSECCPLFSICSRHSTAESSETCVSPVAVGHAMLNRILVQHLATPA